MYFGNLIESNKILDKIYFEHYLRWYKLYNLDFTNYISYLKKLKDLIVKL